MTSTLIITSVDKLQKRINSTVKSFKSIPGVYVSLNKTHKSIEKIFENVGIKTNKIFFIDCVTSEKAKSDVLHIAPTQLDLLSAAIRAFIKNIKEKKFLVIDAISTLLIYNSENKVAKFVKEITEYASENDVKTIAFSPKTKGEELLNKIFNFFDNVEKE